jgi:hypothetical protein
MVIGKSNFGFLALTSPMLRESQFYEPCKNWGMRGAVFQFILRPNPPILFVRARKIGSRSGSYVRFVDLVNEPALDGGPREDAHESALSSDL